MKNTILEKLKEEAQQYLAEPAQETFIERKKKEFVIDASIEYPDPEYLIEIGGVPTLPRGNLVALSAKWKNGKTFLCDVLSAIFLGSDRFAGCRPKCPGGKVQFFDTEQAMSDTARILKTIHAMTGEQRHGDIHVYCLRNADIDSDDDNADAISRFDFISQTIALDHPDLVFIDGIADLIYNYNDVIESQEVVNKLAAIANENNCCIVVVMHQNKGNHDRMMKGHIGTMLYQKCSDVFQVEKHGEIFIVSHPVSRHRQSSGLVFKLDENAIPKDGSADRQRQMQIEKQQSEQQMRVILADVIPQDGTPIRRSDIVEQLTEKHPFQRTRCYELIKQAVAAGWLEEVDRSRVRLKAEADVSSVRPL